MEIWIVKDSLDTRYFDCEKAAKMYFNMEGGDGHVEMESHEVYSLEDVILLKMDRQDEE